MIDTIITVIITVKKPAKPCCGWQKGSRVVGNAVDLDVIVIVNNILIFIKIMIMINMKFCTFV